MARTEDSPEALTVNFGLSFSFRVRVYMEQEKFWLTDWYLEWEELARKEYNFIKPVFDYSDICPPKDYPNNFDSKNN